jgi:hypothetical protein
MLSKKKIKKIIRVFFPKQVKIDFPIAVLSDCVNRDWNLPEGYTMVSPNEETDLREWGELLNSEKEFGKWTSERVKEEIVDQMIAPHAGTLLYYNGRLVGCCSTVDKSTKRKKIGVGMWLVLEPAHRGFKGLAHALSYRTLAFFVEAGYDKIYAYTDEKRLSALYLYLTLGAVPAYDSITGFLKWRRILKRLKPLMKRAEKRIPKDEAYPTGPKQTTKILNS